MRSETPSPIGSLVANILHFEMWICRKAVAVEQPDEPEYEIDRILDRKRCRGKFEYLVQYKGYPLLKDCQWRPHDELSVTAPIILEEFTAQFSKEPAANILNKRKRNTVQNQSS